MSICGLALPPYVTPVLSESGLSHFPVQIAALRDEAAQLLRVRPIPADAGVRLLGQLYRAEQLSLLRYEALIARLGDGSNETLRVSLERREIMERRHINELVQRIALLGGTPPAMPEIVHGESIETLKVVASSLLAKRGMVKLYRAAIRFFAQRDRESAALLRTILAEEELHIAAMRALVLPRQYIAI